MKHLCKICSVVWCLLFAVSFHVIAASDGYNDSGQASPSMGDSQGNTDKEQDSPSMGNTEGQNDSEEESPSLQPKTLLGDVNHDGSVTMADANMVVNYFLATNKPEDFDVKAADVNGDGSITMADANQIVNMFLGSAQ